MNTQATQLTVALARELLYEFYTPDDPNSAEFLPRLNKVTQRLINSGKWLGNVFDAVFDSSDGHITLPYEAQSILGVQVHRTPGVIFNEFHEYSIVGPGELRADRPTQGVLIDAGDGYATKHDILEPNYLKFILNAPADAGITVRVFGEFPDDEGGEPIYDSTTGVQGRSVTLAYPSVTTNFKAKRINHIVFSAPRDALVGFYVLTDGDDRLLSHYLPWETIPNYKRYKTQTTTRRIGLKLQRRWVQLRYESDPVYPGNLAALQLGGQAYQHETTGYLDQANQEWATALNWLSQEARANRGAAQFAVPYAPFGPYVRTVSNAH